MSIRIIGADLGLNHGELIFFEFEVGPAFSHDEPELSVIHWDVVYSYNKKSQDSLKLTSTVSEISELCRNISVAIRNTFNGKTTLGVQIAADFDQTSVHWRTRKQQVVKLANYLGYLQRTVHELGISTISITPAEIRKWLGLAPSATKEEVHKHFVYHIRNNPSLKNTWRLIEESDNKQQDRRDSFVLSVFLAEAQLQKVAGGSNVRQ